MIKPSVGKYVRKRHINPNLDEIFESNDMVINTMKSKSMIMGSSRKIQYLESNFNIFYDDV
jgi:hypothetical protein